MAVKFDDLSAKVTTWMRAHPHLLVDALIGLALSFLAYNTDFGVSEEFFADQMANADLLSRWHEWQRTLLAIWIVAAGLVIATFRTWPKIGVIAGPGLLLLHLLAFPTTQSAFIFTCAVVAHLGRFLSPPWRMWAWPALVAGISLAVLLRPLYMWNNEPLIMRAIIIVVSLVMQGFFWLWGANKRRNDLELQELEERALFATYAERTRIAREMHDIVAHSLSGIIAQSDGGRYAGKKDPEKAIAALETIGQSARQSLEEMRSILSVLRDEEGTELVRERQSPPGISAIPRLISDTQATGLQLTYTAEGEAFELSEAAQLTIYRIIQESLTNVIKHAGNVRTTVTLTWSDDAVTARIHNESPLYRPKMPPPGAQRGITGMRERVKLHDGTLDINTVVGYTVTATLPRKSSTPASHKK
ncbi:sensor histidine kinase [Corynebacterium ulceribovis]|uniref:sensor histidine kinase n=1 Tax=Corynebacterium ulceribovis TaxID=487732 RepID=UPI0003815202|nr:histidine kinase [Corynebacterium ulceribovis]